MSGGQLSVPMVIRGPGWRGASWALHSSSSKAIYCNTPGLKGGHARRRGPMPGPLKSSIRDADPVVFIEAELLYSEQGESPHPRASP